MRPIIPLTFFGPFTYDAQPGFQRVFEAALAQDYGLYLWTIEYEGGYLVNYVGETERTFAIRIQEGRAWSYGKKYDKDVKPKSRRVVDPDLFVLGQRRVISTPSKAEFFADLPRYTAILDQLYRGYRFFLAPTQVDGPTRRRIERGLIRTLQGAGRTTSDFLYNDPLNQVFTPKYGVGLTLPAIIHGLGKFVVA
jgi:hypothetical protein